MDRNDLVAGKKYKLQADSDGGYGWFIPGSIIEIVDPNGLSAIGPAKEDGIDLNKGVNKGEPVQGYVSPLRLREIPEPAPEAPADYHVSVNPNSTTIVIQKRLSIEEIQAVLKAAGV